MKEYIRHIEEYVIYWYSSFTNLISEENWGNKELAKLYLVKYWLEEKEYLSIWKPIQERIFIEKNNLPDLIFKPSFELIGYLGGSLFNEKNFIQLQNAMKEAGEEYFVVVQHSQDFTEGEPMFRMKFPVNISWNELASGNYISAVLLDMYYNNYYVFGSTGTWGKYSANDYDYPVEIIGFKPELTHIFQNHFHQTDEEKNVISEWLPEKFRKRIN